MAERSETIARHKVHAKIAEYFKHTSDPTWKPVGHRGYAQLRRTIMAGREMNNDLV